MSTVEIGAARETAAESLPELAAGLAVVVLTILGLAGVSPTFLVEIATIVFGVGLLLYGTTTLALISRILGKEAGVDGAAGVASGWAIILVAGARRDCAGNFGAARGVLNSARRDCCDCLWRGLAHKQQRKHAATSSGGRASEHRSNH